MEWLVRNRGSTPRGRWLTSTLVAGVAFLAISCSSDSPTESTTFNNPPPVSSPIGGIPFAVGEAGNGAGQCLGEDAVDAGFLQNLDIDDLNCTSNDVDISFAEVTYYSINDPNPAGGFSALPAGEEIDCVPGDVIYAVTDAKIANNAQERYDLGLWINPTEGGSALTGPSPECLHFNLVNNENGATIEETGGNGGTIDQCGDVAAEADTITVPLDTLVLTCPAGGATTVTVDACAAWSNSTTGSADRVCPVNPPGGAEGFRYGTTPGTVAKCRCEPLDLPINVKGVIRVDKVTVPSGDAQSFGFTPTGTDFTTPFNLTDASAPHSSGPIDEGTYTVTETVPAGWALTARACVFTGTSDPADFTTITNGVSVELGSGEDVTCTFTNTKLASLSIVKDAVPNDAQDFDFDGTGTGIPADIDLDDDADGTLSNTALFSNLTPGGTRTVTESAVAGWTLTNIACTGATSSTVTIGADTDFDAGDNSVSVGLAAGENVVCTFTNTRHSVTVTKTATETFNRKFTWEVIKTTTDSSITLDPGQIYNHPYSVYVDTTGYTDNTFAVTGNITINNPTAVAVQITAVADTIAGVGGVTVDCGATVFPYNLAAGGQLVCTYSSSLPNGTTRLNTAYAKLNGITAPFTDDESINFSGVAPTTVEDNCIVVKDEGDLGDTDPLGTVCVSGTTHPAGAFTAPKTFNYTRTVPTGPAQCGVFTYNNTATGTTNTTSTVLTSSVALEVTIECPEGCTLTQGYWKTHNASFALARNGKGPAPDETWELLPDAELSGFFTTGGNTYPVAGPNPPSFTWFQVFWTAPKGNVYYNLAHQYMAAKLNDLDDVTPPADVQQAILDAENLFDTYTPAQIAVLKGSDTLRQQFITLAGILGEFNEGLGGVEHCTEDATSGITSLR